MRIFHVITLQLQSGQCGTEGSPRVANLWLHIQSGSPGHHLDCDGHHWLVSSSPSQRWWHPKMLMSSWLFTRALHFLWVETSPRLRVSDGWNCRDFWLLWWAARLLLLWWAARFLAVHIGGWVCWFGWSQGRQMWGWWKPGSPRGKLMHPSRYADQCSNLGWRDKSKFVVGQTKFEQSDGAKNSPQKCGLSLLVAEWPLGISWVKANVAGKWLP